MATATPGWRFCALFVFALLLALPAQAQRVTPELRERYERGERLTDEELRLFEPQGTWQTLQGARGAQVHVPVGAPEGALLPEPTNDPEGRSAFYNVTTGIPNGFVDISATGTPGPTGDAVLSAAVTLPSGFTFPFYGVAKTGFKISTDGYITFNTALTSGTGVNTTLPATTNPNDVIAALWDDLNISTTSTPPGQTDQQLYDPGTPGDPTDDRYIIQWTDARFFGQTPTQTFQIQLYQNGNIEIFHNALNSPQTDYTIGIENSAGTVADLVYFDGAGTPASTTTGIRFTYIPPPPPSCTTLTTPPNGATNVAYGFTSFAWAVEPVATGYFFDLGLTPGGNEIFNGANVGNATAVSVTGLTRNTTYYWTVRPYNGSGTASGCAEFSFTTDSAVTTYPFSESFTGTTFPPQNWTRFDNANGSTPWLRNSSAPIFAQSQFQNVTTGVAQDYLATPALVVPAGGLNLTFKMWQGFTTVYNSVYKVLVSTNRQTVISDYTVVATWNETTACPGGTGAPPTVAPTTDNCSLSLAAYAGQTIFVAFLHENDDGDNFNLDDVTFSEIPSQPTFSITPSGTVDFGTAGACVAPTSTTRTFTISNTGAGTLVVSGASLGAGTSPAYAITSTPSFPINLAGGQSTAVTVTFAPAVGQSGSQTGTLEVSYDVGAGSQTTVVNLTGTADGQNFALGSGAGYLFRNSNEACAASSPVPAPGTALVPFTGHSKITTLTGGDFDDGYFDVDAATLDALIAGGSFRMFGRTFEALRITSNGNVLFNPPAYSAANDRTVTLPSSLLGTLVAGAGMDLDTRASSYSGDNAGIGGTPGIWYGAADVDADGDDEMVVTYYHAYEFGSLSYPSTAAIFFTFQVILHDAGEPNREDRIEVRFYDGLDANNVPFRQNTAPAIENDVAVGLSNAQGTASSEYRDNSASGGPLYGSNLGVRFEAEVQAVVDDSVAGWRMMGAPVRDFTVDRLADLNLVAGVNGEYPAYPEVNLRIDYDGIEYVPATDVAQPLVPGQGFMWYLFNDGFQPDTSLFGAGTSVSYPLPMELEGTGAEVALTGGNYSIPLHTDGKRWNLIANPFRQSLDLTGLAAWATGGTLASAVGQIFLPTSESPPFGTYVLTTDPEVNNVVTAWQGFLVENDSAATLDVPGTARTTGGSFVGREGPPTPEDVRVVAFRLSGGEGDGLLDRAALLYFHPEAEEGWDVWDVSKLAPLSNAYAAIAFGGERGGAPVAKAQESRPFDGGTFDVPMQLDAVGMSGSLTLAWPSMHNIPETWSLTLTDLATGDEVDLREASSYTFELAPGAQDEPAEDQRLSLIAPLARGADRFVLHVAGATTGTEPGQEIPTVFALDGAYPNPFNGSATVRYAVPEEAHVTVEVFDLLGRRVATLVDAAARPGYHNARWDATAVASGVYVVRMRSDAGFAQSRRVTLLK